MFRWYHEAVKCYVYLSDVSTISCAGGSVTFQESRWFTRGWTLQELLAPKCVEFFSAEGNLLGSKSSRVQEIANITGISIEVLLGRAMSHFSVEQRMAWASRRETTREEDIAYSLFGMFDVHMPLIYGEGKEKALRRLRKEIRELSEETAISLPRNTQNRSLAQDVTPTYCIPFLKYRHFVGRRDELYVLKQKLMVDRDCKKMSIVGLGGTGKTQVALQFAYMIKETWPEYSIFWMPALSMASFEQACADIARALHIPLAAGEEGAAKELVKQHLSAGRTGRWLLVLDNADDTDILFGAGQSKGIVNYLPESEEGVTVYTTRTLKVAVSLTRGDAIELGSMDRQDAKVFLEKSLIRKDLLGNGAATAELLDELTCLPLAIAQAAAYLNMNRMPIAKYLRLLRNTEQDIVGVMSREFRDDTRYEGSANAVATTWVVSFSQVQGRIHVVHRVEGDTALALAERAIGRADGRRHGYTLWVLIPDEERTRQRRGERRGGGGDRGGGGGRAVRHAPTCTPSDSPLDQQVQQRSRSYRESSPAYRERLSIRRLRESRSVESVSAACTATVGEQARF
jgi:hypothetical protein